MDIYCKKCKKHTKCTHPDKKAKAKSNCAKYLTDRRTFFNKIRDEYDLEQLVKHFFLY